MNSPDKKLIPGNSPPRMAIPDGKGGYTYEELETFDLRKPHTPGILPIEVGTRRGVVAAPDDNPLTQPAPGEPLASKVAKIVTTELKKAIGRAPSEKGS